jgi:hypothetical protein
MSTLPGATSRSIPRSDGWLPKRLPIPFPLVSRNRNDPLVAGFLSVVREELAAHHPKPAEDASPPPWPDDPLAPGGVG